MGFNDPNAARNIPLEGWIRNGTTPLGPASENEQVPTMRSIVTELASRVGSGRHFLVTPVLGPEAVTGSSRMKGNTSDPTQLGTLKILFY
jgi:N-acetylmuramic acid 6-phosphate (MurNAc-6-P) etherase